MADFLLLGAGFSRNWGGWLASEVFEHLLGCPEIVGDVSLRKLLWQHQHQGGFEAALAELQLAFARDPDAGRPPLMALQSAVTRTFADMNKAFVDMPGWEFQQDIARTVGTFLTRFDAIFTLNQDLLLERHYVNDNIALTCARRWAGAELPGMRRTPPQDDPMHDRCWARSSWTPLPEGEFKANPGFQPIYKLHGSSNWARADGTQMLIMGGAKLREIGQTPILSWYAKVFEERLTEKGTRLMAIGYGFRDEHINAVIAKAAEGGMKLFIVAPEGAELARRINPTRQPGHIAAPTPLEATLEQSLVGASRRSLREIFGSDAAEFNKVMRFFAA